MVKLARKIIDIPAGDVPGIEKMFGQMLNIDTGNVPPKFRKAFDGTKDIASGTFGMKAISESFELDRSEGDSLILKNGVAITSAVMAEAVRGAFELVFCVVALYGYEEADEAETNMFSKLFLDNWGTAYIECADSWLAKTIARELEEERIRSLVPGAASGVSHASVASAAAISAQASQGAVASRASYAALTAQASRGQQAPLVGSQASAASVASATSQASIAAWGARLDTQHGAQQALTRLNQAISVKDNQRAELGAKQNRLENTITNLTIQAEMTQYAESRISDVDVATEMSEFTKNNHLTQAATAMLAQANSLNRMAVQLIGG